VRLALGVTPRLDGLSPTEAKVLVALRSAPFGLLSERAVARRGGLSPTATGRALKSLRIAGLVTRTTEMVAAGRAREVSAWSANVTHRRWPEIDRGLGKATPPARSQPVEDKVPTRLRHLFWNTADSQLDVGRAGGYIARRLLRSMDLQGLAWGARALSAEDWRQGAKARGLDSKTRRLAQNLAEATWLTARRGKSSPTSGPSLRLPEQVRRILPADTAKTWLTLASHLPSELYLGGGTAVAVHLGHRESRDLDLFFHRPVDLGALKELLGALGPFAVSHESEGTLKGLFGSTKIEVFDAGDFRQLAETTRVAGVEVAGLQDLMAMKIKVMAERGEMRDYFDVKAIDEEGGISVEEGIELYAARYAVNPNGEQIPHLFRAMGDLTDVEVDEMLPIDKAELQAWWSARQVQVLRNSDRFG
jgi:DNA-binding transcriptional ArsR family regulator